MQAAHRRMEERRRERRRAEGRARELRSRGGADEVPTTPYAMSGVPQIGCATRCPAGGSSGQFFARVAACSIVLRLRYAVSSTDVGYLATRWMRRDTVCGYRGDGTQVSGTEMQVSSTEMQVSGTEMQVSGTEMQVSGTEMQVSGTEMQVSGTEMQVSGTEMQVSGTEMQLLS
eukprot:474068-Rhodomonas_salina.1